MPPSLIVTSLAQLLGDPDPVLPAGRVGSRRPALVSDLPSLAVAMSFERAPRPPATRFVREGHQPTEFKTTVQVSPTARGFDPGLTEYALEPLPLVQPRVPGASAVVIANVTNPQSPRQLRQVLRPTTTEEFRLDHHRGRVVFGAPLSPGEVIEVTHWAISWREPFAAEAFEGVLELELWTTTTDQLASIGTRLQARLAANARHRPTGFIRLVPMRIDAAEILRQETGLGGDFPAWRQRHAYEFAFESTSGGTESAGDRIRRIDVDIDDTTPDRFHIGG